MPQIGTSKVTEIPQFGSTQRFRYERAYSTYQAALAEHKLALSTYHTSIRDGTPFCFGYQFDIRDAYDELHTAMQGGPSSVLLGQPRPILHPKHIAVLIGLCLLLLVIGMVIGAVAL